MKAISAGSSERTLEVIQRTTKKNGEGVFNKKKGRESKQQSNKTAGREFELFE
ncbi:MAG: hypothetical protein Q8P67_13150 [archaeon]|nr:hypothetical protein [archaeon]